MALSAGDPPPAAEVDAPPARAPELTIIYSAGLEGYLTPCGCDEGQTGGLAGWATVADEVRRSAGDASVWIDGGDLADTEARMPYVLEAYRELGCSLIALSDHDLALGAVAAASARGLSVLQGAAEAPGRTVAVGPYRVHAQEAALNAPPPPCPGGADVYVLVRRSDQASNVEWVSAATDWDGPMIVLGVPADEPTAEIRGQVAVVQGAARGSRVVAIDFGTDAGRLAPLRVRRELVTDKTPWHPAVQRIADGYYAEQQSTVGSGAGPTDAPPDPNAPLEDRGVALALDCRSCHHKAYDVWQESRHARALETLRQRARLVAECVGCHSQVYRDTGRLSAPGLPAEEQGLTCMACHGAATTHAMTGDPQFVMRPASEAACTPCHRPPHTTGPFDWGARRGAVRHW